MADIIFRADQGAGVRKIIRIMQGDAQTHVVRFVVPRHESGVDLAPLAWYIRFIDANGKPDIALPDELHEVTEDEIRVRWTIDGRYTAEAGSAQFELRGVAKGADGDALWRSGIGELEITEGLDYELPKDMQNRVSALDELIIHVQGNLEGVYAARDAANEAAQLANAASERANASAAAAEVARESAAAAATNAQAATTSANAASEAAERAAADANKAAQEYVDLDGRIDQLSEEIGNYRSHHAVIDNYNIYAEKDYNIDGYWINASGEFVSNADSKHCKVPVCGGNELTIWYDRTHLMQSSALGGIVLQDMAGNTIAVLEHADHLVEGIIYQGYGFFVIPLPVNCAYVLITTKLATAWDDTDRVIMKYGAGFGGYTGLGNTIKSLDGFGFESTGGKPYSGVRWAVFGDSLTEVNATAVSKYHDWLAEKLGFTVVNYGSSGTGYMRTYDEGKAFYQRMANIEPDAFDFMTIFGSGNDIAMLLNNTITLGTADDYSAIGSVPKTIGGAINQTLEQYYSLCPTKPIGLVTPTPWAAYCQSWRFNRDNGIIMQNYADLIVEIGRNRGIPVLNLFNTSGFRPWNADFRAAYYKENGVADGGTHPNSAGHKLLAAQFEDFVKRLMFGN